VAEVSDLEINAESSYEFTYKRINKELSASKTLIVITMIGTLRITFNKDAFPVDPS